MRKCVSKTNQTCNTVCMLFSLTYTHTHTHTHTQSYPGPTNSIAGGAYVCNGSSSGSGGSHGCISTGLLMLSYACPLHLEHMNPISTQLLPNGTVCSTILQVLKSDLTLLQGVLYLISYIASSLPQLNVDHDVAGRIEHSAGQSTWGHPYPVPQPLQLALGDHGLNTSIVGLFKYFNVRHTILPGNSQNVLKGAYMEAL